MEAEDAYRNKLASAALSAIVEASRGADGEVLIRPSLALEALLMAGAYLHADDERYQTPAAVSELSLRVAVTFRLKMEAAQANPDVWRSHFGKLDRIRFH